MSDERELRNAVFSAGAPAGINPNIPSMSSADKMKAEFGLDVPLDTVPIPSQGKVYPPGSVLHNRDSVEIRAMTAREEDILTSRALGKKGTVINELLKSCLTDSRINPLDMLSGDRQALMVAIRITGYSEQYDAEMQCEECNSKSKRVFDLSQLPLKFLNIDPVEPGRNLFEFLLPYTKKIVRFRFLTGRDELEMFETAERQKKLGIGGDNLVTANLTTSIVSVDGREDRSALAQFVKIMPARDSLALRSYISDNEPGIVMKQEAACGVCGHSEEVNMPKGATFFWPSAGR